MPASIDPETINVDELPGIWSPVQWDLTEEERIQELEEQAKASLLWVVDVPEAILRLLIGETEITRAYEPPDGFDPELQGEWDENLVTFQFKRGIQPIKVERQREYLYIEYKLEDYGYWAIEISPEEINIQRL
jgi:hypothetical protein